jgi:hypothetical protein
MNKSQFNTIQVNIHINPSHYFHIFRQNKTVLAFWKKAKQEQGQVNLKCVNDLEKRRSDEDFVRVKTSIGRANHAKSNNTH